MLDKEKYVTKEIAQILFDLGYDQPCTHHYIGDELKPNNEYIITEEIGHDFNITVDSLTYSNNKTIKESGLLKDYLTNTYDAPSYEDVKEWLIEEKGLYLEIVVGYSDSNIYNTWHYQVLNLNDDDPITTTIKRCYTHFDSYRKALIDGIHNILLNILK